METWTLDFLVSGSSWAWLRCSLNHSLNRRLHQSKGDQLLSLGPILGRPQPPGGQCRDWPKCQWIDSQGGGGDGGQGWPGAGVGAGPPEVILEKAVPMRSPGKQAPTCARGSDEGGLSQVPGLT